MKLNTLILIRRKFIGSNALMHCLPNRFQCSKDSFATFDRGQKIADRRIAGSHQPVLMLHSLPTCNVTMSTLCVYIKILLNLFKCWHLFFYPYVLFHLWIFQIIFTVHSSNYFFLIKISHRLLDAPRNGLKDVRNHVYVFFFAN